MLKLENLTKIFDKTKVAVDHIDLEVQPGEIFGFIGPNGAGKTTTIKMMAGILQPTEGTVTISGIRMDENPLECKRQFTFVPDQPEVFEGISGNDYLQFIADIYDVPVEVREERIRKYAEPFEIYGNLPDKIGSYSHGMRQKLLITGALLPNPRLFILDEPMTGLDPKSSRILKDIMREHCDNGGMVFFSSHVLEVVENLCDRVAIIHNGKLLYTGTVKDIMTKGDSLESIFLEMTKNA